MTLNEAMGLTFALSYLVVVIGLAAHLISEEIKENKKND